MQDYLIVKGKIDLIKYEQAPEEYKPNEWTKLDRIVRATIRMHLSQSMYYTVQSDLSLEIYFFRRINPLCMYISREETHTLPHNIRLTRKLHTLIIIT